MPVSQDLLSRAGNQQHQFIAIDCWFFLVCMWQLSGNFVEYCENPGSVGTNVSKSLRVGPMKWLGRWVCFHLNISALENTATKLLANHSAKVNYVLVKFSKNWILLNVIQQILIVLSNSSSMTIWLPFVPSCITLCLFDFFYSKNILKIQAICLLFCLGWTN